MTQNKIRFSKELIKGKIVGLGAIGGSFEKKISV